jgi:hypothetical protein
MSYASGGVEMASIVPRSAQQILQKTLDSVRIKANSDGECFGGEIMDAMREAGQALGADRLEVWLTRTALARMMESIGEPYPAEVLQNYEQRIPVSHALKYLRLTIDWIASLNGSTELPSIVPNESESVF